MLARVAKDRATLNDLTTSLRDPDYHPVVFQDTNNGAMFLTRSTVTSPRTIEWPTPHGARTYPLVVVEVSADSHLFWTGGRPIVDDAGQVEKFHRRYGNRRSLRRAANEKSSSIEQAC